MHCAPSRKLVQHGNTHRVPGGPLPPAALRALPVGTAPRALSPASCLSPARTPGLTRRLPSCQQLPSFLWFGWSVISSTDRRILSLLCSNFPHLLSPHLEITCWGLSEPHGPLPPLLLIWHWELTVHGSSCPPPPTHPHTQVEWEVPFSVCIPGV